MTPEELQRQEESARALIEALGRVSRPLQAPADFVASVLARADALPPHTPRRRLWWPQWLLPVPTSPLLRMATIGVVLLALVGAIPQYLAWLQAYRLNVPSQAIHEAEMQERLWRKNFACATSLDHSSPNYAAVAGERVMVVVWTCPSGDVLVTLESPEEPARERYIWLELARQQQAHNGLFPLIRQAQAEPNRPAAPLLLAQAARVLCQTWLPNGQIKRRVQLANGKCQEEIIDPALTRR